MSPSQLTKTLHKNPMTVIFAAAGTLLLAFILLPILSILFSANLNSIWQALTDSETLSALTLTFSAAAIATGLAFLTGVPLAYLLARYDFPGKRWLEGLVNLPVVIPHTAAGIALLMVFGRQAPLGQFFQRFNIHFFDQLAGIVVGMLFVSLPFLVNGSREAFELVDAELERVAQTEGASSFQAFLHVTLPLAWRGIAASAVMMWGRGISEFGAIVIIAYHPKIVPVLVFERFSSYGLDTAQPVAIILILASLFVFIMTNILINRNPNR